ncbi:MAG: RlmE family RNA methyltransferase [Deltaproteobacteria bacterium]|nr:RlmE family RNA methyltransferase [Deltaproteobacteria bacterium]
MATYDRKDAFHQRAKREGYRSRAAYKLLEIQAKHRLLTRGQRVVDLGCWPGGWLQVAAGLVGPSGRVVGVDVAAINPPLELANVIAICRDLSEPGVLEQVLSALGGRAQVLLSDAAPKLTGVRATDRAREEELLTTIAALVPALLAPGGDLLIKLFDSPEADAAARALGRSFEKTIGMRPEASRRGTSERYLLARGYRPDAP